MAHPLNNALCYIIKLSANFNACLLKIKFVLTEKTPFVMLHLNRPQCSGVENLIGPKTVQFATMYFSRRCHAHK